MKKNSIFFSIVLAVGLLGSQVALAQDGPTTTQDIQLTVDGSALLKVTSGTNEGGTTVKLTLAGASEAGAAISSVSENVLTRLKISSLAGDADGSRRITAMVTTGTLENSKTKLSVQLLAPTAASLSNFVNFATEGGTVFGSLQTISDNDGNTSAAVEMVGGIRTCWSGTAVDDGYQIHYKYEATGGGTPVKSNVTVTYTIEADV
jgi:hypothetical protein